MFAMVPLFLATEDLGLVHPGGIICRIVDFAPNNDPMIHRTQSLDLRSEDLLALYHIGVVIEIWWEFRGRVYLVQRGLVSQLPGLTHLVTGHDEDGHAIIQEERAAPWRTLNRA
jgi:hypothetical protein